MDDATGEVAGSLQYGWLSDLFLAVYQLCVNPYSELPEGLEDGHADDSVDAGPPRAVLSSISIIKQMSSFWDLIFAPRVREQ